MLTQILECKRQKEGKYNLELARQSAEAMRGTGGTHFGLTEEEFCTILATENFEQLRKIFSEYRRVSEKTMHQGIRYAMAGGIAEAMLAIGKKK